MELCVYPILSQLIAYRIALLSKHDLNCSFPFFTQTDTLHKVLQAVEAPPKEKHVRSIFLTHLYHMCQRA